MTAEDEDEVSKYCFQDLRLYSRSELSEILGVSIRTVDRWADEGVITRIKIGGTVRFSGRELQGKLFTELVRD
jgi:excisionase family DNA binding protein